MGVRSAVAHLATRSVRYLEAGSGRPVIWLHAFPLSADLWLPQLHRVPPGWRFIAPDLRGFRGSGPAFEDITPPLMTIDDYAADVLELMAHLDVSEAVIGGLSMGGYVAFALWHRAPERVSGLVLASTRAAADTPAAQVARARMVDLVDREGAAGVAREMLPKLIGASLQASQPDLIEAVRELIVVNTTDAIRTAIRAMKERPDSTPLLPRIDRPVTVIHGDEDAIIPLEEARAMAAAIPGARLIALAGVGHLANLEDPLGFSLAVQKSL